MTACIVLIGFSGTGKSSVGRELSRLLDRPYVDSDDEIVARFGKSIARVFREEGEAVFRAAEREIVADLCERSGWIVSLGGGAVVDPETRRNVKRGNVVVRLEATPETILRRLTRNPTTEERPLLAGDDPLVRITTLKESRAEAYAIADLVIDTEGKTPAEVAAEIVRWLKENETSARGEPRGNVRAGR